MAIQSPADRLDAALRAAGVPITGVSVDTNPITGVKTASVYYAPEATAQQRQQGDALAAGFDLRAHVQRPLYAIYADLQALTAGQKTAVWADLSSGSPKKYLLDLGPNAAAIAALDWAASESGATGAALTAARLRVAAMYCQDNTLYLAGPAFDPTINVPGEAPAS